MGFFWVVGQVLHKFRITTTKIIKTKGTRLCITMKNREKDNSYGHILKYAGVFGGVQALSVLVGLVRSKLVALLLGPAGMGLMSIFNTGVRFVSDTTNMGLSATATRETSEAYGTENIARLRHSLRVVRSWSLLTAILGFMVCLVASPLLNSLSFDWGNHTLHFALLAPVVAMTAITTGELAVLKGTHQLRQLARISIYGIFAALVISIPLLYIWGEAGIVPSLLLVALAQMLLTANVSFRLFPYKFSFNKELLASGKGMLRLGISFMLAGFMGSGAEFAIRAFMNTQGNLEMVGLYNVAYMMAMVYAGMVFSAMETDYFPRLSTISEVGEELYNTVNKQMEITILLAAPLLSVFILFAPFLLTLLFSSKFLPVVDTLRLLLLAMYFRALTLPVEYINLARGNARGYLLLEVIYDLMVLIGVTLGFYYGELMGAGIAWLLVSVINLLVALCYVCVVYHFAISLSTIRSATCQLLLGIFICMCALSLEGWRYWLTGCVLFLACMAVSLCTLRDKIPLRQFIKSTLTRRRHD